LREVWRLLVLEDEEARAEIGKRRAQVRELEMLVGAERMLGGAGQ
jgi:hypothetical protein